MTMKRRRSRRLTPEYKVSSLQAKLAYGVSPSLELKTAWCRQPVPITMAIHLAKQEDGVICTGCKTRGKLSHHVVCASLACYRLVGLLVKASVFGAEDPGFESRLRRDFSGSSHTSDLKIGTPVATLPGAWPYRVSTGTGRPNVSIL